MALENYKQTASFNRGFKLTHDAIVKTLILGKKLKIKRSDTGTLENYQYKGEQQEENLSFLTKNLFVNPVSFVVASPIAAFVGGLDRLFGIFDAMIEKEAGTPRNTSDNTSSNNNTTSNNTTSNNEKNEKIDKFLTDINSRHKIG